MWALTLCSLQSPFGAFPPLLGRAEFSHGLFSQSDESRSSHQSHNFFDLSCGPTLEPTIVLQPLRSCEGVSPPGCPGRVANALNHVNEAIACRPALHAPAGVVDQTNGRSNAGLESWVSA